MTAKEVKILLIKKGLNISDMARDLEPETEATFKSLQTMIADLLYGRRWFPSLAAKLEEKYDIRIEQPKQFKPIKEQLKQAA
ncbi:MAG: hypothetical protein JSS81_05950 [Acidobacteria bacterium]|nr:hypothetical protein [Acidobacteriota bacterium]